MPEPTSQPNENMWSPLVKTIFDSSARRRGDKKGMAERVAKLVAEGEDPNENFACMTIIELAAYHGDAEMVAALINAGARVPKNALGVMGDIDVTDNKISSREAEEDYAKVAELLIAQGANTDALAYTGGPLVEAFPPDRYPNIHRVLTR